MPDPSITTIVNGGVTSYSVANSKGLIADLSLFVPDSGTPPQFKVTFPTAAAGVQVTLIRPNKPLENPLDLLPPVLDSGFSNRQVHSFISAQIGPNSVLSCDISAQGAGSVTEPWTVQVSNLGGGPCVISQGDNIAAEPTITRVMCDPVAKFTISALTLSASTVLEKDVVTLTAVNPTLMGPVVNVVGLPLPETSYSWTYEPETPTDNIAITSLNTCSQIQNLVFTAPGVYGPRTLNISLQVWFGGTCPNPAFLNNTGDPQPLTIAPRPQYLLLVLDRSGSMLGDRWDNAMTAARMLVNLFAGLRAGVAPSDDRLGVIVFEDPKCSWQPTPSPLIAPVPTLALGPPGTVELNSCAANFGPAGTCTPIGDGLIQGMKLLDALPKGKNAKYTIILLTDGYENSGSVRVDLNGPMPSGFIPMSLLDARSAFPDVNSNLSLYTIGLGATVQEDVLQALANQNGAIYLKTNNVLDLQTHLLEMVGLSYQGMMPVVTTTPLVTDPSPPAAALYFHTESFVNRLAVAVGWSNKDDILTIEMRPSGSGESFTPVNIALSQCPTFGFFTVDVAGLFGGELSVPATEWRLVHTSGAAAQAIPLTSLAVLIDLYVMAEIEFDRPSYRTGQPMVITARIAAGNEPVTKAIVEVELERSGEGLGTFLATNGANYTPPAPVPPDPPAPKQAMLLQTLRHKEQKGLPLLTPSNFFVDGSNRLIGTGDGKFANVFGGTNKEGTYTWRFRIEGRAPDGSRFSRVIVVSKWVGVQVDPGQTPATLNTKFPAPPGFSAVEIVIRPIDKRGEFLGPFRASEIRYRTTGGAFWRPEQYREFFHDGLVFPQPDGAGTFGHYDGRYSRVLVFKATDKPVVSILINSIPLKPVVV